MIPDDLEFWTTDELLCTLDAIEEELERRAKVECEQDDPGYDANGAEAYD